MPKKLKLLIVDDEKDICKFVKMVFKNKGFLVYNALTGRNAVKIAKKVKPDIVLMDLYLRKGIDGIQALCQISKISPKTKCIMVTWEKAKGKIMEAKKLGAVSYLTKPLTVKDLIKAVSKLLKGLKKARK